MGKKETIRSLALAFSVVAICITVLLVPKRCGSDPVIPAGKILINESFLDSLRVIAEMPPVITVDTVVVLKDTTIIVVTNNPTLVYVDTITDQRVYVDSVKMIDDGINAWVEIRTRGVVEDIIWGYRPVFKTITKEIRIPEPYPVEYIKEIPQRGLFLQGGIGAGSNNVGFSLGLMWQQRNGLTYGVQALQFDSRYYMFNIGFKIF